MQYTIFNVVKHNTDIKGYWKEGNKTFIDNIQLISCNGQDFIDVKNSLFDSGELAIFYKEGIRALRKLFYLKGLNLNTKKDMQTFNKLRI